jgi:hypothetical protein
MQVSPFRILVLQIGGFGACLPGKKGQDKISKVRWRSVSAGRGEASKQARGSEWRAELSAISTVSKGLREVPMPSPPPCLPVCACARV